MARLPFSYVESGHFYLYGILLKKKIFYVCTLANHVALVLKVGGVILCHRC